VDAVHPLPDAAPPGNPIDEADLLARVDGDTGLLAEIIDLFLEDAETLLGDVRQSVRDGDADRVVRAAHRLKGSVATLSATQAARAALGLETLGRAGDLLSGVPAAFVALEKEFERLVPALQALRARIRRQAA
jgi:two-component system, sensor histidine kinase and response regulator